MKSSKHSLPEIVAQSSLQAAPLLLGWIINRQTPLGVVRIRIVETEAYHQDDPASHSFRGLTARTAPMFETGGRLYIYFTYGAHYCINIVTGAKGVGEGVLIRAGEPVEGVEIIQRNRGPVDLHNLTNGPGKLAQALGITSTELSGQELSPSTLWLEPPDMVIDAEEIVASPRVGITKAKSLPWRFYISGNPFVSRSKRL